MSIIERLDKLRLKRGLTWDQLGQELELSRSMLHYIRKNQRQLSARAFFRLEQAERAAGIESPAQPVKITAAQTLAVQEIYASAAALNIPQFINEMQEKYHQIMAAAKTFQVVVDFINSEIQADPELKTLPFYEAVQKWIKRHKLNKSP